jgi:hypothetical protein
MTALGRMIIGAFGSAGAALALLLASPVAAQNNDAPVDVTAAPPPSAETVGPSQLRDFNLQGRVTRPSDRPATPAQPATTATAPPSPGEVLPSEATRSPAARATGNRALPARAAPPAPSGSIAGLRTGADTVTPPQPVDVSTNSSAQPEVATESFPAPAAAPADYEFFTWPWIAALICVIGGGALLILGRGRRRQRYADAGRMAFAGMVPDGEMDTAPYPLGRPKPDPIPPRAQPTPKPDPVPPPTPAPRSMPKPVRDDGMIVSTGLKPQLDVQFTPDRAIVTENEIMLQFDVVLANSGSAAARDVLVHAEMFTAHAGQDQEIAAFFQNPMVDGDRMTAIPPLGKISLKTTARLPLDQIHSFEAAGRKLFVPLVGFNILYRSSGGEGHASASFLVGRGNEQDDKLAPFRLDLGPRIFRGLSARPHSMGLQPA